MAQAAAEAGARQFARLTGAECVLASASGGDVEADGGIVFTKLRRLAEVERCALICVPGGFGTIEAMEDQDLLAQIRRLAKSARYVTSVCTGSLVLGAAGLLKGKRATSHWAWRELLSAFGAKPDPARVVCDGNVITGGGAPRIRIDGFGLSGGFHVTERLRRGARVVNERCRMRCSRLLLCVGGPH